MRILHTSDWHIGRSFHGHRTLEPLREVLAALTALVAEHSVDLVLIAGDVFDSATPAADCFPLLSEALAGIRAQGAEIVLTSGNHDSAARLGFHADFLGSAGVHVRTRPEAVADPVVLHDRHGPVHVYGIPYLEPALVRHLWPVGALRTQEQTLTHAMGLVRDDLRARTGRSVVVSHCFAAGVEPTPGVEREVRQGSLDVVPLAAFDGVDYVALGHIHGRQTLREGVRYSGAPLHYSFGEQDKPRGVWLVDLDADGLAGVEWADLPVPRPLSTIRGPLEELLGEERFDGVRTHWVRAQYTDPLPQTEPMRRLKERFPHCATVVHTPDAPPQERRGSYRERVRDAVDDEQRVEAFLSHVREGRGASAEERSLLREVLAERRRAEAGA